MVSSLPERRKSDTTMVFHIGVLALQGAFHEHILLLRQSATILASNPEYASTHLTVSEVRTAEQLQTCDALVLPGGESTTMSLVAARSNLLEPLRDFVKVKRKPVWGTCAGLILLAESANRTKQTGQELIGGLDVRVNRNHFGRQTESFEAELDLPFLEEDASSNSRNRFRSVFIRAPVVEMVLEPQHGIQEAQACMADTIVAPSKSPENTKRRLVGAPVEVMARLPGRAQALRDREITARDLGEDGDIVAVRQGNVFGTSFHPELTGDARIHVWWLRQVIDLYKTA
ncbi:glutamine amidotransferase subunit pdxT [Myriangium duriaei CBS 260.36]|uniref:glutaminase n=1 Tax=Myriangium duriaei CBS 260.36 TaxID=1168546 RepID=A0A9P4MHM5_9PEZI|nr:glutamine amidotransferase subunit pdxT [Myriangium duriaei CBS 260.36]